MRATGTIAIVASDQGLLRSLVFALEVEGFSVFPAAGWSSELDKIGDIACFVADADSMRVEAQSRDILLRHSAPLIFLADGFVAPPDRAGVHVLPKPFRGGDLTGLLRQLVGREAVCRVTAPAARVTTGKPVRI